MISASLDVYAYTNPLIRSGEFVLGVMAATLARRGTMPKIPLWLGLFAVCVAWGATYDRHVSQSAANTVFAVPFALLVIAAANRDLRDMPGILRHRLLIYAGQFSFAFYLVHELVLLNGVVHWGGGSATIALRVLLMVGLLGLCTLFAVVLHECVEKPAQKALRGLRPRQTTARSLNN